MRRIEFGLILVVFLAAMVPTAPARALERVYVLVPSDTHCSLRVGEGLSVLVGSGVDGLSPSLQFLFGGPEGIELTRANSLNELAVRSVAQNSTVSYSRVASVFAGIDPNNSQRIVWTNFDRRSLYESLDGGITRRTIYDFGGVPPDTSSPDNFKWQFAGGSGPMKIGNNGMIIGSRYSLDSGANFYQAALGARLLDGAQNVMYAIHYLPSSSSPFGRDYFMLRTTDNWQTWASYPFDYNWTNFEMNGFVEKDDPNTVYFWANGNTSTFVVTRDGGVSWRVIARQAFDATTNPIDGSAKNGTVRFVVDRKMRGRVYASDLGSFWFSDDYGVSWKKVVTALNSGCSLYVSDAANGAVAIGWGGNGLGYFKVRQYFILEDGTLVDSIGVPLRINLWILIAGMMLLSTSWHLGRKIGKC